MASGGHREGAGRPTDPQGKKIFLSLRVFPGTKAKLQELAAKQGASVSTFIDRIVEKL